MQIKLAELMTWDIVRPFSKKEAAQEDEKCFECGSEAHLDKEDENYKYFTCPKCHNGFRSKKSISRGQYWKNKKAEVLDNPYQSLTNHITDMKSRMSQVQERLQSNPLPKQAGEGEKDNSKLDLPMLLEDLVMGVDLLETKLGGDEIESELHANVEELENLLWTIEEQIGITPKLSEEEKAEPEHKEIVEQVEKESALPTAIAPTLSSPAPTTNASPAPVADDKKTSCALCGGLSFNDYAAYQQHMAYSHASDTMPTSPTQKTLPTVAASKKVAVDVTLTDETIEEGTGTPPALPATTTTTPSIQNVQPTDDDNLEIPVVKPTSLPAPGQIWQFDPVNKKYVSMPDPANPGQTI